MSPDRASATQAFELFVAMRRRGERVDPAAFAARYPEHEHELLPALEALVELDDSTRDPADEGSFPGQIGPYRILRQIGRGGMGVVLEAVEEPLGRRVALKILPPENLASAIARERFRREAKLASQLEHSGIATIYGAGVDADQPWIAMRFVTGESLATKIAAARDAEEACARLGPQGASDREYALRVASCIALVARALQFAHERGIVHRDVKPSNILITPDGMPVLLDFGLAIGEDTEGPTLTRTGQTAGTPAYLPPELVSGERTRPDAQSDVYALGVTLYECLALRRPFEGPTQVALYRAIVSGAASDVRAHDRAVPRDLAVVVATAMERDPARRYSTALALASDLEACAAGLPIQARPLPLHGRIARWARREPRQALLTSLLAMAVIGIALFGGAWWSSRDRVLAADRMDQDRRYEDDLQEGFATLATRHAQEADRIFAHALAIRPDSIEALVGRALVCIDDHRDEDATKLLSRAPDSPAMEALRDVARSKSPPLDLGNDWLLGASSIELFVDGLRIQKQGERRERHERKPAYALAAARFTEAVNRSPGARGFFQIKRAFAGRDADEPAVVRSAASALVALWPDSARAVFTAGNTLVKYDRPAAMRMLRRSIELDPRWGPPHQLLGNAYFFAKDYENAVAEFHEAIRRDPHDADAFNSLGVANELLECPDEGREAFEAAVALRPWMFEAWANLGCWEASRPGSQVAEHALRTAVMLAPDEPLPHVTLGRLLRTREDFEGALAEYEIAIGVDASNASAYANLSALQTTIGHPDVGLIAAEIAIELDPKQPDNVRLRDIARARLEEAAQGR